MLIYTTQKHVLKFSVYLSAQPFLLVWSAFAVFAYFVKSL